MTQEQIHNLAMTFLLDTEESRTGLIWTTDWSTETSTLTEEGQRMLERNEQRIINALNQ